MGDEEMIERINTMNVDKVGSGEISKLIRLPKNIKQIGQADSEKRIYIEDYVVTFIRQRGRDKRYVLLGSSGMVGDVYAVFINGAIVIEPEWDAGNIMSSFSSGAWECIYKEIKENFPSYEIVGWSITSDNWDENDNGILKSHIANFPGEDKVLYVFDVFAREEYMYKYYLGALKRQKGYYMYYDKNEMMQAYMMKVNKSKSVEANYKDETTQKIRTIALKGCVSDSKGEIEQSSERGGHIFLTTLLAVAMLALAFKVSTDGMGAVNSTLRPTENVAVDAMEIQEELTLPPKVIPQISEMPTATSKMPGETQKPGTETKQTQLPKTQAPKTKIPQETVSEVLDKSYVVKEGDTLVDISYLMYGTVFKVEDIMKANNITDKNVIVVGQELIIPR